jgi:hypothetical protein
VVVLGLSVVVGYSARGYYGGGYDGRGERDVHGVKCYGVLVFARGKEGM